MKKRVLALMLVLGMTFSLAACGSSNDKKSDDTKTEDILRMKESRSSR